MVRITVQVVELHRGRLGAPLSFRLVGQTVVS